MKIICDSREQSRLEFPTDKAITDMVIEKLPYGDYMIEFEPDGVRPPVVFERKSLGDLFGTLGKGYERFRAEILGARQANLTLLLLLENSLRSVWAGSEFSQRPGQEIVQQLFTLQVRYRLPVIFCQDRAECARYILEYGKAIGRCYAEAKQVQTKVEAVFGAGSTTLELD